MKPSEAPGWQIDLAWRQKLAAYWAISWPAWLASFTTALLLTSSHQVGNLPPRMLAVSLVSNMVFYVVQAILTRRLVRKNFRSFRVGVIRSDGAWVRQLSTQESFAVWLWILGPQFALLLTMSLIGWWYGANAFASLSLWLQLLAVGPYAVGLSMRAKYSGFRLQAFGFRYI